MSLSCCDKDWAGGLTGSWAFTGGGFDLNLHSVLWRRTDGASASIALLDGVLFGASTSIALPGATLEAYERNT